VDNPLFQQQCSEACLILFCNCGIFGWDLNKRPEPIWEKRLMPATTQFENTEKVWKSVGYLPANEESRFK
jgi:hypothetical protein